LPDERHGGNQFMLRRATRWLRCGPVISVLEKENKKGKLEEPEGLWRVSFLTARSAKLLRDL
jgi:hypothetical protein